MSLTIETALIPANEGLTVNAAGVIPVPKDYSHGIKDAAAEAVLTGLVSRVSGDSSGRFTVEGELSANVPVLCSLCLGETSWHVTCGVLETFAREPEDIDEWAITDNVIDLTPALVANIIMHMPMRITCGENCEGISINN